jgi:hypothetical protein
MTLSSGICYCKSSLLGEGFVSDAEKQIKSFKPRESRLLLALSLGCFLVAHMKIAAPEQRNAAERIAGVLAERVSKIRDSYLKEFKTELLELRQGKVVSLDYPKREKSDDGEGEA